MHLIFDDMSQCTEAEVSRLLDVVSPQRREQAMRIKHLAGRYACLKSYEMLTQIIDNSKLIIDNYDGSRPNSQFSIINYQFNEHGKPFFPDFPDIHFNISHCKHAIAVVVDDKPVGIDVERFVTPSPSLLRYTMNDDEVAQVEQSEHPERTFAMLWTQKEALFKLYGTGITDDIRQLLTLPRPTVALTTTYHENYCCTIARIEN